MNKKIMIGIIICILLIINLSFQSIAEHNLEPEENESSPLQMYRSFLFGRISDSYVDHGNLFFYADSVKGLTFGFGIRLIFIRDNWAVITLTNSKISYSSSYIFGVCDGEPLVLPRGPPP